MENRVPSEFQTSVNPNLMEGAFQISRSLDRSEVWFKPPLYLKCWIWMLGKANFQPVNDGDFFYERGEFFTYYAEIQESLRYYQKNRKTVPSLQQVRDMLDWFVDRRMIEKAPVERVRKLTSSSHPPNMDGPQGTHRGEYAGLRVRIVNYDTYQDLENYRKAQKNRPGNRRRTDVEHYNNNDKNEKNEIGRMRREVKRSISSEVSDEALRLAELLLKEIRDWHFDFSPAFGKRHLRRWGHDIDCLMRIDKQHPGHIERVIVWCQNDPFWRKIVLSGKDLVKHFDRLVSEMKSTKRFGRKDRKEIRDERDRQLDQMVNEIFERHKEGGTRNQ